MDEKLDGFDDLAARTKWLKERLMDLGFSRTAAEMGASSLVAAWLIQRALTPISRLVHASRDPEAPTDSKLPNFGYGPINCGPSFDGPRERSDALPLEETRARARDLANELGKRGER